MQLKIKHRKKFAWLILVLCSIPTLTAANSNSNNNSFPFTPRVSIWGSSGSTTVGEGDAMVPFWGNPNQIFFGDGTVKYGESGSWLGSAGLGLRKIVHDTTLLGGYFFTDYNKTSDGNYFTVINPGVELMTNQWDAHLNGYVPVGEKNAIMDVSTATQLNMPNLVFFTGHAEYDPVFNLIENVGPGVDAEVGYTFNPFSLKRTRIFGGAYHFDPKYTSNINGVVAGIEIPFKYPQTSFEVQDSYDNVNNNTLLITLRINFGGLDKTGAPTIQDRMLDRIPRHLGTLDVGDGIPSQKKLRATGGALTLQDNIWFFNPGGTPTFIQGFQNCTFEHPCLGLAQSQIDTINSLSPKANFYFSPGTYNNPLVGTAFSFYNGQNIFGRTSDFKQLATGNDRALLNDSILLNGNNDVYNIQVFANSELNVTTGGMTLPIHTGILATSSATGTINISNTSVTSIGTILNVAGVINNSPSATLNLNNSTVSTSLANKPAAVVIGIANTSSGTFNLNGSTITTTQSDTVNNFNVVFGAVNNENGTININNSTIQVNATNAGLTAGVLNNSTIGLGTVNITGSTITTVADNSNLAAAVFNQANNLSGVGGTVNIDQSSLNVTSLNNLGGLAAGVFNTAQTTTNVSNSTINASGNDGIIAGFFNSDPLSTANLQNNIIAINLSGAAFGLPIINNGTLIETGNQCFVNGMLIPC